MSEPLTLALPKGRLFDNVKKHFATKGIEFSFEDRKLTAYDNQGLLKIFLVKNSDLPTYVNYGIAGLGICGEDVVYESGFKFNNLHPFDFGGTRICLCGKKGEGEKRTIDGITVATKFTEFTKDFFHNEGTPVKIIKLNGSVELAPILGLAPYIVDLVETGNTLKANNLEVIRTLNNIKVNLICNPAYYKTNYEKINKLLDILKD